MSSPISVIESRWWDDGNHSVRDLFSALSAIHYENPSSILYDMFADKSSLGAVMNMRGADAHTEIIYLGAHGDSATISAGGSSTISRTEFRNIIVTANAQGQLKGLYLGTCLTGNRDTAEFIFSQDSKLEWIAGYSDTVDWIDGSAIDMVFFHKLATIYLKNKSKKKKLSATDMAHNAATEMLKLIPGAHANYGFNMFFKDDGSPVKAMFLPTA